MRHRLIKCENGFILHKNSYFFQADIIIDKAELTLRLNWVQLARSLGATFGQLGVASFDSNHN
jgi:hypothetical protein